MKRYQQRWRIISRKPTSLFEFFFITLKMAWNTSVKKFRFSSFKKENTYPVKDTIIQVDSENKIENSMNLVKAPSTTFKPWEEQLFFPLLVQQGELTFWDPNGSISVILQSNEMNESRVNENYLYNTQYPEIMQKEKMNTQVFTTFLNSTTCCTSPSKNSWIGLGKEICENHLREIVELRKEFLKRRTKNNQIQMEESSSINLETKISGSNTENNLEYNEVKTIYLAKNYDSVASMVEKQIYPNKKVENNNRKCNTMSNQRHSKAKSTSTKQYKILMKRNTRQNNSIKYSNKVLESRDYSKNVNKIVGTETLNHSEKRTIEEIKMKSVGFSISEPYKTKNCSNMEKTETIETKNSNAFLFKDEVERPDKHKKISSAYSVVKTNHLQKLISEINQITDGRSLLRIKNNKLILDENLEWKIISSIPTTSRIKVFENGTDFCDLDKNYQSKRSKSVGENLISLDASEDKSPQVLLEVKPDAIARCRCEISESITDGIEIYKRLSDGNEEKLNSFDSTPTCCQIYGMIEDSISVDNSIENKTTSTKNKNDTMVSLEKSAKTNSIEDCCRTIAVTRRYYETGLNAVEHIEDPWAIENNSFRNPSLFSPHYKQSMMQKEKLSKLNRRIVPPLSFQSLKASPKSLKRKSINLPSKHDLSIQHQENINTSATSLRSVSELSIQIQPNINEQLERKESIAKGLEDISTLHSNESDEREGDEYLDLSSYEDDYATNFERNEDDAKLLESPNSKHSIVIDSFTELRKNTESYLRKWYRRSKKSSFRLTVKKMCSKLNV